MEEELAKIFSNAELDDNGKKEAIKKMVGESFIPTKKFSDEKDK